MGEVRFGQVRTEINLKCGITIFVQYWPSGNNVFGFSKANFFKPSLIYDILKLDWRK